jgi:prepilin-type N-terminal cleavage/methylation domain-containing protein
MTGFPRRTTGPRAFTLLEVILAIALLGIVASLFITGGSEMFRARERTLVDVFWSAVQAARLQAVQEDTTVTMRFDEKARRIVWRSANSEVHGEDWPGRNLEFLSAESRDAVLIGGQQVGTGRLVAVRFHADGTTDRFRAQLTDANGKVSRLELDPWTAAPVVRDSP